MSKIETTFIYCVDMGKVMPVLIGINNGRESSKTGVIPKDVDDLVRIGTKLFGERCKVSDC
jgi:uncharacterized pyridoxal phosphate-containing UPF0001 family protein